MENKADQPTDQLSDQPWGFWVVLRNQADARWAVTMSGLVIFLMGLSCLTTGALLISGARALDPINVIFPLLGAGFVFSGLMIRAGHTRTFIPSTVFFFFSLALQLAFAPGFLSALGVLQGVLMISSIRAWVFLRRAAASV